MSRRPDLTKTFGDYIRNYRKAKGLSLRRVARDANISPTYLSQVERDERRLSEEKLVRLGNAIAHETSSLLAKSGHLTSEVSEIVRRHPEAWHELIVASKELSQGELDMVVRVALMIVRSLHYRNPPRHECHSAENPREVKSRRLLRELDESFESERGGAHPAEPRSSHGTSQARSNRKDGAKKKKGKGTAPQ